MTNQPSTQSTYTPVIYRGGFDFDFPFSLGFIAFCTLVNPIGSYFIFSSKHGVDLCLGIGRLEVFLELNLW